MTSKTIPLDNFDIFAQQYVEVYDRLRNEYPWMSISVIMVKAKKITIEYLYLQLKSELKVKPFWPVGFKV